LRHAFEKVWFVKILVHNRDLKFSKCVFSFTTQCNMIDLVLCQTRLKWKHRCSFGLCQLILSVKSTWVWSLTETFFGHTLLASQPNSGLLGPSDTHVVWIGNFFVI
jgi:hypothetical protein